MRAAQGQDRQWGLAPLCSSLHPTATLYGQNQNLGSPELIHRTVTCTSLSGHFSLPWTDEKLHGKNIHEQLQSFSSFFCSALEGKQRDGEEFPFSVAVIPTPGLQFIRERLQNILMWKGKTNGSPFGGGEGSCFAILFSPDFLPQDGHFSQL